MQAMRKSGGLSDIWKTLKPRTPGLRLSNAAEISKRNQRRGLDPMLGGGGFDHLSEFTLFLVAFHEKLLLQSNRLRILQCWHGMCFNGYRRTRPHTTKGVTDGLDTKLEWETN